MTQMTQMTGTARELISDGRAEMTPDDRRARFAMTAATVAAAEDGHLHRSLASVPWERRGLLQRLVRAQ